MNKAERLLSDMQRIAAGVTDYRNAAAVAVAEYLTENSQDADLMPRMTIIEGLQKILEEQEFFEDMALDGEPHEEGDTLSASAQAFILKAAIRELNTRAAPRDKEKLEITNQIEEVSKIIIEEIAKIIYEAMPFPHSDPRVRKPDWVENGNSIMQEDARAAARKIHSAIVFQTVPEGMMLVEEKPCSFCGHWAQSAPELPQIKCQPATIAPVIDATKISLALRSLLIIDTNDNIEMTTAICHLSVWLQDTPNLFIPDYAGIDPRHRVPEGWNLDHVRVTIDRQYMSFGEWLSEQHEGNGNNFNDALQDAVSKIATTQDREA